MNDASPSPPARNLRIACIPGDGVGPEVMRPALLLLEWLKSERGLPLEIWPLDLGAERYLREGVGLPEALKAEIRATASAVLLGAVGDARVPDHAHAREILFGLRFGFDLYANVRPVKALTDALVPLVGRRAADVDWVIFRENTEGLYAGVGGQLRRGTTHEVAIEEDVNTRLGVERILRAAFEFARRTGRRLCMSDKSNALRHAHDLWQRVFQELRREFSDVEAEHLYIDALCYELVRDPARFSVMVSCNLFGDIVSDLAAALGGGLGLAPSANLCPGGQVPGLFEPVHGSAPGLVGRGTANPIAMLRTVGLMLEELGYPGERAALERACAEALRAGEGTVDVGGGMDTNAAGAAVLRRFNENLRVGG
ncbi:MAG TPA: isocitrate/isopropylmalate family dehydrogenase [Polyangiaceae bacterium]|nr:isocitrate/isopropylmalate family dehydrogenase [Polyangiaceae bacterium]